MQQLPKPQLHRLPVWTQTRMCGRLPSSCTRQLYEGRSVAVPAHERPSEPEATSSSSVDETLSSLDALLRASDAKPMQEIEPLVDSDTVMPTTDAKSQLPQDIELPIGPVQKEKELAQKLFDGSKPILQELRETPPQQLLQHAKEAAFTQAKDFIKPTHMVDEKFVLPRVKPRFSYLILAMNIAVYAYGLSLRFTEGQDGPLQYFESLANSNIGVEQGEYYRLFTSNWLHDSFVHLAVSSYALFTIAPEAESILGVSAFLTTYILGGVAGSALCFLLTDTMTVGASSGLFGLIGAMGSFLYKNHRAPQASDQVLFATGTLLFNLFLGGNHETTVDNLGHLGSLVCGVYLGYLLTPLIVSEEAEDQKEINIGQPSGKNASPSFPVDLRQAAQSLNSGTPSKPLPATSATSSPQVGAPAVDPLPASTVASSSAADLASAASSAQSSKPSYGPKIYQPNPLQSLIVLFCVSLTLGSGVAATVLHRTGSLPVPIWPVY